VRGGERKRTAYTSGDGSESDSLKPPPSKSSKTSTTPSSCELHSLSINRPNYSLTKYLLRTASKPILKIQPPTKPGSLAKPASTSTPSSLFHSLPPKPRPHQHQPTQRLQTLPTTSPPVNVDTPRQAPENKTSVSHLVRTDQAIQPCSSSIRREPSGPPTPTPTDRLGRVGGGTPLVSPDVIPGCRLFRTRGGFRRARI
jgi:hypothetical protein